MEARWSIVLRPIKFSHILGQAHVTKFCWKVLADYYTGKRKTLPVGMLFGGRSGVGKTTMARVIAASLNCPHRKKLDVNPCGVCKVCKDIQFGKSLLVHEIDSSFFGLVDNVRKLREQLGSYSFYDYRLVILDECHMMSREAFNVLLKMLEEPPDKVMFILVTTEVSKVLDTVRSRLVEFRFKIVEWSQIWKVATLILNKFKIKGDEQVLYKLYEMSGFNVREFFMSLEYLTTASGGADIDRKLVEESFGGVFVFDDVLDALRSGDFEQAVSVYENYSVFASDFDVFISRFVDFVVEKLREKLRAGSPDAFVYSTIVSIMYRFLQTKSRLSGVVAAKVLFFDIVSHLTKGNFGIKRENLDKKALNPDEILEILTKSEE